MSSDPQPAPVRPWIQPDTEQGGYDMSTSILATGLISLALVVAVLLFLHLYIRFVLRRRLPDRGHRLTSIDFLRIHAATINIEEPQHAAGVGLDPSAIAALPSYPYRKTGCGEDATGSGEECAVCLCAVEEGEMVRLLPACKHLFHVGCIDMWLASHTTCPVCRALVEPPAPAAAAEVAGETETSMASQVRASSGEGTSGSKDGGSVSRRLSASLKRILSGRDRSPSSSSSRRVQGESTEDLERQ